MKAVISNRIYMEVPIPLQLEIDKELTYTIASHNPNDPPQIIKNMSIIRSGLISIPIGRTDLIPNDYEIVDKRLSPKVYFPDFKFDLRQANRKYTMHSMTTV